MLQFCSGAEFDRRNSLDNVREEALFTSMPIDPYGLSKNTVARISVSTDNFYNIRLFGVFYPIEFPGRLLPKILSNQPVNLEDKYFDYLYLEDLLPLIEYYINNAVPKYKDINVVYPEKMLLSEFVKQFCVIHNLEGANITFGSTTPFNYSGNADKFDSLNLPRIGLEAGMKKYK
jgi:GDP-L-fucose synthase